ncbi:MAG TPA: hypothetical protein VNH22_15285 [Blastocatellia bacterium]|nr:hypothetical protein [Blastocatellia bacterium]
MLTATSMQGLGRSDYFIIGGLMVAAFFGLSILVFIVVFIRRDQQAKKKCPHCAETIKADAALCRFCNRPV